jgi:hypothetical protein
MRWLTAALLMSLGAVSSQAYTCDDVRSLSSEQKAYYIRVFNITPAQQQRIRHACDEPKVRRAAVSMEEPTGRFGHAERDVRAGQ